MNENQPHAWIRNEASPLLVGAVKIHQLLPSLELSSLFSPVSQAQPFILPVIQTLWVPSPFASQTPEGAGLSLAAGRAQPSPSALPGPHR